MDLQSLGEMAGEIETIIGVALTIIGIIASPKLWKVAKFVVVGAVRFSRGVQIIGSMLPTLERLPFQLEQTSSELASLREQNSSRQASMAELSTRIDSINKQVNPNGGKSLHDLVKSAAEEISRVGNNVHLLNSVLRFSWDNGHGNFGIFYAEADGQFTYCSATLLRTLNRTETQMRGWGWLNAIHPDERAALGREWDACIEDGREFYYKPHMVRGDESQFGAEISAAPIRSNDGTVAMWVGMVRIG